MTGPSCVVLGGFSGVSLGTSRTGDSRMERANSFRGFAAAVLTLHFRVVSVADSVKRVIDFGPGCTDCGYDSGEFRASDIELFYQLFRFAILRCFFGEGEDAAKTIPNPFAEVLAPLSFLLREAESRGPL